MSLFAVHLSDGLLEPTWLAAGFALAAVLAFVGAYRIREEDIPQTAVLAAAFFVASTIHVPVGPTSAHLLLNGLLGIMLGRRAALAILVGLSLQALLFGHGGYSTLGVNTCVMALPAFAVGAVFYALHRQHWARHRWFCTAVVVLSTLLWMLCLVGSAALMFTSREGAVAVLLHPLTVAGGALAVALALYAERRLEPTPEFALGLLLGQLAVLTTLVLNAGALIAAGEANLEKVALGIFVVHLPIVVIEGIVLGFTVSFLARVKPELLGLPPAPASSWQPATTGDTSCPETPVA